MWAVGGDHLEVWAVHWDEALQEREEPTEEEPRADLWAEEAASAGGRREDAPGPVGKALQGGGKDPLGQVLPRGHVRRGPGTAQ